MSRVKKKAQRVCADNEERIIFVQRKRGMGACKNIGGDKKIFMVKCTRNRGGALGLFLNVRRSVDASPVLHARCPLPCERINEHIAQGYDCKVTEILLLPTTPSARKC